MGSAYEFELRICAFKDQCLRPLSYDDRQTIQLIQKISQNINCAEGYIDLQWRKKELIAKCYKFTAKHNSCTVMAAIFQKHEHVHQ